MNLICLIIVLITTGIISYKYGMDNAVVISVIATILVGILELGVGLITMGTGNTYLTAWAALVTVALAIRELLR